MTRGTRRWRPSALQSTSPTPTSQSCPRGPSTCEMVTAGQPVAHDEITRGPDETKNTHQSIDRENFESQSSRTAARRASTASRCRRRLSRASSPAATTRSASSSRCLCPRHCTRSKPDVCGKRRCGAAARGATVSGCGVLGEERGRATEKGRSKQDEREARKEGRKQQRRESART